MSWLGRDRWPKWLAWLALCCQLLLPYVHTLQMASDRPLQLAVCSMVPSHAGQQQSIPADSVPVCPICVALHLAHWAVTPVLPALLPLLPAWQSWRAAAQADSFLPAAPAFLRPPAHAPPVSVC